jgi:hypothetical protein
VTQQLENRFGRPEWDSLRDFYADRGGEGATEVDYGYDWTDGRDRFRISWNPETGDVYAREMCAATSGGSVILVGEGISEEQTVANALWLDDSDETSRFVRNETAAHEETTTLEWAISRLAIGTVGIETPPDGVPPGLE